MATIKDRLAGYIAEQGYSQRTVITVKENGKKYSVKMSRAGQSAVYQIDGDVIKEGIRCDKLILFESYEKEVWNVVFVELKGRDIFHAVDQIEATITNDLFRDCSAGRKCARIVGRNIPRNTSNSHLSWAKIRFKKNYNCDLRAVNPGTTESL